jgi:CheY-like chemotaxis protein
MDGFELAGTIRSDGRFERLPLLLLTSAPSTAHRAQLGELQISGAYQKPVRLTTLLRAVHNALNAEAQVERPGAGAALSVVPSDRRPVRVLVVEDNLINQKVAVRMLERLGHVSQVAGNGVEGLAALAAQPYDIVFMDCQMPEMDGFEATRTLRDLEKATGRHTPVIALTANVMNEEREQCRRAGMDDFLAKPVRYEDLSAVIDRWRPAEPAQARTA